MSESDLNNYSLPRRIWISLIGTSALITALLCVSQGLYLAWYIVAFFCLLLEFCEIVLRMMDRYGDLRANHYFIRSKIRKAIAIMVGYASCMIAFFSLGVAKVGIGVWHSSSNLFSNIYWTLTSFVLLLVLSYMAFITIREISTHLRFVMRKQITMPYIEVRQKEVDAEIKE